MLDPPLRDDLSAPILFLLWEAELQRAIAEDRYRLVRASLELLVRVYLTCVRGLEVRDSRGTLEILTDQAGTAVLAKVRSDDGTVTREWIPPEHLGANHLSEEVSLTPDFSSTYEETRVLLRLWTRAEHALGTPLRASEWLFRSQSDLGGSAPVDVLNSPEAIEQVDALIDSLLRAGPASGSWPV